MKEKKYYKVTTDTNYKTSDHLQHGYETEHDYKLALRQLLKRFAGRVGELVDERHDFYRLMFRDTPDGQSVEQWLPAFLLLRAEPPHKEQTDTRSFICEEGVDDIFGFDE